MYNKLQKTKHFHTICMIDTAEQFEHMFGALIIQANIAKSNCTHTHTHTHTLYTNMSTLIHPVYTHVYTHTHTHTVTMEMLTRHTD